MQWKRVGPQVMSTLDTPIICTTCIIRDGTNFQFPGHHVCITAWQVNDECTFRH